MPERSFGRTIRYRRTKLGLSQTKLGELVGRSATTIRAWERDRTTPNDPEVVVALAAVLGIDERVLFDKIGLDRPEVASSPTVEEVLAELAPDPAAESVEAARVPDLDGPPTAASPGVETPMPQPGESAPSPVGPYLLTVPSPTVPDVSYLEDPRQRQLYRIRYLATAVAFVALIVALLWALNQGLEAFSAWWDGFFGSLQF